MEADSGLGCSFQRLFLAGRQLRSLPWADLEEQLKESSGHMLLLDILHRTVLHPLCMKHPPSMKYRRLFLSELIKKHEATAVEPLDELYDALGNVLNMDEPSQCHKSYFLPSGEAITLSENVAIISEGTTGLVTWEAALYLAEWAVEHSDLFNKRTVLELGSGIGLTGLTVCKTSNPKTYIFSDYHKKVLHQLSENIQLNGFHVYSEKDLETEVHTKVTYRDLLDKQRSQIIVMELDWETVTKDKLAELEVDLVIAADVVYDPEIIVSLSCVLQKLLNCRKNGKAPDVYLASTIRNPDTYHLLQAALEKFGIGWELIPGHTRIFLPSHEQSNIEIIRLYT